MITKAKNTFHEYPRTFWTLIAASFVDQLGGFILFPFFALYITDHFSVGMTQVGILFTIFAASSLVGSVLGGALTDKFGRKSLILFGLLVSALFSVFMGSVNSLALFYLIAGIAGLMGSAGGPARQAMIADILPEEQQTEGFGISRISANLAASIGPMLGGLLAAQSFLYLFIADAITSVIMAVIVILVLPETKPDLPEGQEEESLAQTVGGYGLVFRDHVYMAFIVVSMFMALVYFQMNTTLSVFLRDVHSIQPLGFGYILSLNASMVVLFQFWVTRRISSRPPMLVMAFGTVFYIFGFGMYGFISGENVFVLAMLAMVIITIGEMIVTPVAQALVAKFAPSDMRGRYMAIYGMSWSIPIAFGPLAAGIVMDNYDPNWVWYAAGIISIFTVIGFLSIHTKTQVRLAKKDDEFAPASALAAD